MAIHCCDEHTGIFDRKLECLVDEWAAYAHDHADSDEQREQYLEYIESKLNSMAKYVVM